MAITTRFFILSDTHGSKLQPETIPSQPIDVAIHCGDLSEESKIEEFKTSLEMMNSLPAAVKLVIAGNHDFTLDTPMYKKKLKEAESHLEPSLVKQEFGDFGEARRIIDSAKEDGVIFLDEGERTFTLRNGARLKVFASPYTPSTNDWAFQYDSKEHREWGIDASTDVVVTHGPPQGILDRTSDRLRAGCPNLFGAVARARPRMHCFGHIHEGWGAKMVGWRERVSDSPSHFTDVDNDRSFVIQQLSTLRHDALCAHAIHRHEDCGSRTLFVNAAIEGTGKRPYNPPWIVEIDLDKA